MKSLKLRKILSLVLITVLAVFALSLTSCGQDGSVWHSGEAAPTAAEGKIGDFYLETDTLDVWEYKADGWVVISNIKGATGETGAAGADGEDGADGEKGDTGATGATGATGEKGDPGEKGDKGDKGDTGATGAAGESVTAPEIIVDFLDLTAKRVAVMDYYFSYAKLTGYSGTSIASITVWAEADGSLYIGTAKVADVVAATKGGTELSATTEKYTVVEGKNTIELTLSVGSDETIVLGGQGSVGLLFVSGLNLGEDNGTSYAYADGQMHKTPLAADATGMNRTLVFSAEFENGESGETAPVVEGAADWFTNIGSLSGVAAHACPFPYKNIYDLYSGKTLTKIGIPVKSVAAVDANQTFTLQIFDYTTKTVNKQVTVTLPVDQLGSSTTVNKWVYVDLTPYEITLGETESIAFGKSGDTVTWGYGKLNTNKFAFINCGGVIANATFDNSSYTPDTSSINSIVFDVYYAVPAFDFEEHLVELAKKEAAAVEEVKKNPLKYALMEAGIQYISIMGDSISTFNGYNNSTANNTTCGSNGTYYYLNSRPDVNTVDCTWWYESAASAGLDILVNNSYSGDQLFSGGKGLERCVQLHANTGALNGTNPDIIAVFFGTNDLGRDCSVSEFTTLYEQMLQKMTEKYESSDIFVFTLLPTADPQSTKERTEAFNEAIRSLAAKYNCNVVDLYADSGFTFENCGEYTLAADSQNIHPNAAGMDLIRDCFLKALEEKYVDYAN